MSLYRVTPSDVSEALWEEAHAYGVALAVGEQAALAIWLSMNAKARNPKRRWVTALDIRTGLRRMGINRTIPAGYCKDVERRLRRLYP